jgi:Uma2 family endonuclease
MTAQSRPYLTEQDYLTGERSSMEKHEYYRGAVYAMAGSSEQHNLIAINLAALLRAHLRGGPCRVCPSDMRVKILHTTLYTYPDLTIVCGPSRFVEPDKRDTLINPIVLIEILSPSTELYDRGAKFQHYRTIETLQEYILVAQHTAHVERFTRQEANEWVLSEAIGLDASVPIAAIHAQLSLRDIYDEVFVADAVPPLFPPERLHEP